MKVAMVFAVMCLSCCCCARAQTAAPAAQSAAPAAATAPARAPGSQFHEPEPAAFDDHTGFTSLFDGRSLDGWEGDPDFWHVEGGAMVGESSADKPLSNTYIWRKGLEAHDFDLRLEIKATAAGSGIQYRSQVGLPWTRPTRAGEKPRNLNWMMTGPQADFWYPVQPRSSAYTGQMYSENTPLGIEAWRGEVVGLGPGRPGRLVGSVGNRDELGGWVRINDWNQYEIIARGPVLIQILNGHVMSVLVDDDPASTNNLSGKIGIELEGTPAKIAVRDVWLRRFN